ncbi:CobW family GTP-binding protein [Peptostreptococcus sp. D1]|uniref:CobW family GTP-binding protein n=1 Tax=Peptostreptococcus sp. D1 TaxID=72304 RepID=UPI0008E29F82|nr:GTP-binding protein [Peptostreptococcus sp. D1]SFE81006.1 GTPase, G3E family [Peptostreptococcus sp. D1]
MSADEGMKILVVSGFLGAGKTTFIESIVKNTDMFSVILENEYGELGIDGDILKKDNNSNVWELTEGCICCSMKANFATSVMTINNTINPELLIVEPTGIGMLSSIMKNIDKVKYDRIRILEPITIVDPYNIELYMNEYMDIFKDQVENSKNIIISKTSLYSTDIVEHSVKLLRRMNPNATIHCKDFFEYDRSWYEEILNSSWDNRCKNQNTDIDIDIENISFRDVEFDSLYEFESYMGAIMQGRFGNVIRVKGFAIINGVWSKVDIVGKSYTLEKIDIMKESKIILIGSNLLKKDLEAIFSK